MKNSLASSHHRPITSWQLPHVPMVKMPQFALHSVGDTAREEVETYIKNRFASAHSAQVNHFLSTIISMRCLDNFTAAVGIAPAANQPLFAEHYLTAPVEQVISEKLGQQVERAKIIEIGNLVSSWKGSSLLLFTFLSEFIEQSGYHWALFTATREVESLLARMHYSPVVIAAADPAMLPDGGARWGSYYQHQPKVMFGDVRTAVAAARLNPLYRAAARSIKHQVQSLQTRFAQNQRQANFFNGVDQQSVGVSHE
jgi:Thermostable hemolysin